MKRVSKGLIAVAASTSLLMGSAAVANAQEAPAMGSGEFAAGSAFLGSTGAGLVGSAYAVQAVKYAIAIAILVGGYNWAVDQHLIQPVQLPR